MFEEYFDKNRSLTLIGMCPLFATTNKRDIVKRLIGTCKSFKQYRFSEALALFRACERNGFVEYDNGFVKVFFDYQ